MNEEEVSNREETTSQFRGEMERGGRKEDQSSQLKSVVPLE